MEVQTPVQIAQILTAHVLEVGMPLSQSFEPLLQLTRWQQAPRGWMMRRYCTMIRHIVEARTHKDDAHMKTNPGNTRAGGYISPKSLYNIIYTHM